MYEQAAPAAVLNTALLCINLIKNRYFYVFPNFLFFTELSWNQESKYSAFFYFVLRTFYVFPNFLIFHGAFMELGV